MKFRNYLMSLILLLAPTSSLKSQTLSEVLQKYAVAIGGDENIAKIKSIYVETIISDNEKQSPCTTVVQNGKGCKSITEITGQKYINCYTEKSGWFIYGNTNDKPNVMPEEQYKSCRIYIYTSKPFWNWAEKGYKAELVGKENNESTDMYKIKVTVDDNYTAFYYFDASTSLPIKMTIPIEYKGETKIVTSTYHDYRKTKTGILYPFLVKTDLWGKVKTEHKVVKLEINRTVDPVIF
ncbi:MAG: hypothetical protein HC905_16335, partial [Bacteroidales bacterium]|nr:hypothetical protein [Bacteroidales bacterium]